MDPEPTGPRLFGTHSPKEPLLMRGAHGVVWVKPSRLDPQSWGSRLSPHRRCCGQHTFLQCMSRMSRRPCHQLRLRPQRGRDECAFGGEHSPFSSCSSFFGVRGWWSPQNHQRFTEFFVRLPPQPRLLFDVRMLPVRARSLVRHLTRVHASFEGFHAFSK